MSNAPLSFEAACGMAGPMRLVVEREGQAPFAFETNRPFVRLGSSLRCDIPLRDKGVSQRHACLQVVQGHAMCVDLISRSGIVWSTGRADWGWLEPRESFSIGPFRIRLEQPLDQLPGCVRPSENPLKTSGDATVLRPVMLEFLRQDTRNRTVRVSRPVTLIGRELGCKIRVDDLSVSRTHCGLILTPAGAWVIDFFGRGGITVNGRRVDCAFLDDRAVLRVGKIRFRAHYESGPVLISPDSSHYASASHASAMPPIEVELGGDAEAASAMGLSARTVAAANQPSQSAPSALPLTIARPTLDLRAFSHEADTGQAGGGQSELLRAIVGQLAAFHQQMFDQNQQTMTLIVQMFGRLHREHLDLVRDELDRLDQLTEEMRELQRELSEVARQRANRTETQDSPSTATAPPVHAADPLPLQSPTFADPSAQPIATDPRIDTLNMPTQKRPAAATRSAIPKSLINPDDAHVWLVQRMAAMEAERQTIWDKVCSVLKLP